MHILKIGGGAGVDHTAVLENLARRIQQGERWIVVHGASDAANRLGDEVGYPARMLTTPGGHVSRYTDARTIEIFRMAAANVNQTLTAALRAHGIEAIGLAAPSVIFAQRKTAIRALVEGRQIIVRDDYSGSITGVNEALLQTLLVAGMTPVVAPLALGGEGDMLNVDGDLAAAHIARALGAETYINLSNVPGLLRDVNDPTSLIPHFSLQEINRYEGYAAGRMKKKLLAAQQANAAQVILADSRIPQPLDAALNGGGTHIVRDGSLEVAYA
ncbi:MAG: [LysW]-aminoadipate kinase [Anaerolineae bacterium]|nr:[LysW]-aminoadipate kinase [Anaerolineae bacterium]